MFIVRCKYTNINYRLYYILDIFIISLFNSVFGEVKGGALFHNNATHFGPLSRLP